MSDKDEAFKNLQNELLKAKILTAFNDVFGGPHMKLWSEMTEQEKKDTLSWWNKE